MSDVGKYLKVNNSFMYNSIEYMIDILSEENKIINATVIGESFPSIGEVVLIGPDRYRVTYINFGKKRIVMKNIKGELK